MLSPHRNGRAEVPEVPSQDEALARFGYRHDHGIGEIQADGQFSIVHQSKALPPKAWSPYVEANKGKVADWSWPWVCGGCTSPRFAAN